MRRFGFVVCLRHSRGHAARTARRCESGSTFTVASTFAFTSISISISTSTANRSDRRPHRLAAAAGPEAPAPPDE